MIVNPVYILNPYAAVDEGFGAKVFIYNFAHSGVIGEGTFVMYRLYVVSFCPFSYPIMK